MNTFAMPFQFKRYGSVLHHIVVLAGLTTCLGCTCFGWKQADLRRFVTQMQGKLYIVVAESGHLRIRGIDDHAEEIRLEIPSTSRIVSVHGSENSQRLIVRSVDGRLHLVDLKTSKISSSEHTFSTVALNDNRLVLTWTSDMKNEPLHFNSLVGFCLLPNDVADFDSVLATARDGGKIIDSGDYIYHAAVNNRRSIALLVLQGGDGILLNSNSGDIITRFTVPHSHDFRSCGISSSGKSIYIVNDEGSVVTIDLKSEIERTDLWKWHWLNGSIVAAHFASDSEELLVVRSDGKVERFIPQSYRGTLLTQFDVQNETDSFGDVHFTMAVAPDNLVVATKHRIVRIDLEQDPKEP